MKQQDTPDTTEPNMAEPIPPPIAECPWCGPNGDPEVLDLDTPEVDPDDDSSNVAVVCANCQAQGPSIGQGCHDEDEDGPLAAAMTAAAIAAWNDRHRSDQGGADPGKPAVQP